MNTKLTTLIDQAQTTPGYGPWHVAWLIWFAVSVSSFLGMEIYALATDWRRTLSAAVWYLEGFVPGQHVTQWSAMHVLFTGVLAVLFLWLLGHFSMGWWR